MISRRIVVFVAAVATAASSLGAVGLARAAGAPLPKVMTCAGKTTNKPTAYLLACADANAYLKSLHWTNWTRTSARASAIFVQNTCLPYCAAGKFVSYQARVTLGTPRHTKYGQLFSSLSVQYREKDKAAHYNETLPLAPRGAATR